MSEQNKQPPEFSEAEMRMPESNLAPEVTEHHNRVGLVLGLLIVLLVLILGGLYLWYSTAFQTLAPEPTVERFVPEMPNEPEMQNADAEVQKLNTVSTSNEIEAIEADIESTDLDQMDAELQAIDAELDAAF